LKVGGKLDYTARMSTPNVHPVQQQTSAVTPSRRTLHAELLRLCARIGYSPPAFR
jgi:hypothetical protein